VSINRLVDIVEIANIRLERRYDLTKPTGVRGRNSDNSLIWHVLNWEPSIRLRDGLEKTYAWIWSEFSHGRRDSIFTREYDIRTVRTP
jgi:GDP-D-mannose 3', 5'-epimerase